MKKIIAFMIVGFFLFNSIQTLPAYQSITIENKKEYERENLKIDLPGIDKITINEKNEYHSLLIEGLNTPSFPGKPLLPYKTIRYLLPKGSTNIQLTFDADYQKLKGNYKIQPSSQIISYNIDDYTTNHELQNKWHQTYLETYSTNTFFPKLIGKITANGFFHDFQYITISFCPFKYNPISEILYYSNEIEIEITYQQMDKMNAQKTFFSEDIKNQADQLFYNYDIICNDNQQKSMFSNIYDYIIITHEALVESISSSSFIEWKSSLGFSMNIITLSDERITTQPGRDLAEQIRNFLRFYYHEWEIEYVLFIGDYATVPMRYCYPDPTNHQYDPFNIFSGEVPTDYYFADLSSSDEESWDSDGDGFYGEYGEDNPDFLTEVSVGRIPVNDPNKITYTLNKIVNFEKDTGGWKNHALHAGAFFYFSNEDRIHNYMDGAVLSHYIEEDIMDGWTVSKYSEQEGLETSIYSWPPLSEKSFISDWRNGEYAVVNWQGHGWTTGVARKIWSNDDGNEIPEANEMLWPFFITGSSDLDDDYPSIVTAVSCFVGCPEPDTNGNLGIDLLTDPAFGAAVAVVASARSPYGSSNWPTDIGGSDSIIYEFNKNMIKESFSLGRSLYTAKFYCNQEYGWSEFYEYIDMYTFNLYGDPSLFLEGAGNNHPPSTPVINGPNEGTKKETYTYEVTSTDLDNDEISFYFDWGDGTTSEWVGPYAPGETCSMTHSWNRKNNFDIRVKAQDEKGSTSEWGLLKISISKQKLFTSFIQQFIENLFKIHPTLSSIYP